MKSSNFRNDIKTKARKLWEAAHEGNWHDVNILIDKLQKCKTIEGVISVKSNQLKLLKDK